MKFYCFATHKHISILFSTSLIKSHILESNTNHHYNLSSSSNIIPLPSYISINILQSTYFTKYPYISLIHLTNYISHKLSIYISHIYYKPISHQVPILITHTNYKYYIPQKIYIFYHLHISQEISNIHTKSPTHGRYKLLILKSFS